RGERLEVRGGRRRRQRAGPGRGGEQGPRVLEVAVVGGGVVHEVGGGEPRSAPLVADVVQRQRRRGDPVDVPPQPGGGLERVAGQQPPSLPGDELDRGEDAR